MFISGNTLYGWKGYELSGGNLSVSNIVVNPRGIFSRTGGNLNQSGAVTLVAASVLAGPGLQQFGPFNLSVAGTETNTTLTIPSNACVVRFRDSSGLAWDPAATLTIHNWAGGPFGGGAHQIIVGSSDTALTSNQVRQIFFLDPPGWSPALHAAQIRGFRRIGSRRPATHGHRSSPVESSQAG